MLSKSKKNLRAITLIESMVVIIVSTIIMGALIGFILYSYKVYGYSFQQVQAINEAQKGIGTMVREVREAKTGEDGSYLIEKAENFEFIFFSDIDQDLETERVRYYVQGNDLIKETIDSQGFPPQYSSEPRTIFLSSCIRNSLPIFRYYDKEGNELASPARRKDTKMMQVYLEININPLRPPSSFLLNTGVQIRNK